MDKIRGWDTKGITGASVLDDGRLVLKFVGKDEEQWNIFLPRDTIGGIITTILALVRESAARFDTGEIVGDLTGIKRFSVASDEDGKEFVLVLVTGDGLELRFLFDPNNIEALALGLISTLKQHGRLPSLPFPAELTPTKAH